MWLQWIDFWIPFSVITWADKECSLAYLRRVRRADDDDPSKVVSRFANSFAAADRTGDDRADDDDRRCSEVRGRTVRPDGLRAESTGLDYPGPAWMATACHRHF